MSDQQEHWVATERTRLSASAILLIFLMIMVLLQSFIIFQMYQQMTSLQNQLTVLNAQLKVLSPQIQQMNQRYGRIDALVNLYIQQMVLRMYKEMFPSMSEEELRKLLENLIQQQMYSNATTTSTGFTFIGG